MPEGKGKLRSREEKQENRAGLRKLEEVKRREKRRKKNTKCHCNLNYRKFLKQPKDKVCNFLNLKVHNSFVQALDLAKSHFCVCVSACYVGKSYHDSIFYISFQVLPVTWPAKWHRLPHFISTSSNTNSSRE